MEYIDALQSKAEKSQNTVRKSFRGTFALLVKRSQTSFMEDAAEVSKSDDDLGRKAVIELCGSIF